MKFPQVAAVARTWFSARAAHMKKISICGVGRACARIQLLTRRGSELCDQPVGAFTVSRSQLTRCPTIS
jgi:hypothetical protein